MKIIEFITTETKVVIIGTTKNAVYHKHKIIKKIEKLTFEELISKYFKNVNDAFLADDFGHSAKWISLIDLKKSLENRNIVYEVSIDVNRLTIFPKVKTKKELASFANEVRTYSQLD